MSKQSIYNIQKENKKELFHIFEGHIDEYSKSVFFNTSLCRQLQDKDCRQIVINNQPRAALKVLLSKRKREICIQCHENL